MRVKAAPLISWIAGALSLTHPIQKFVDTYFWDKVLHAAEPLFDPVFSTLTSYGPATVFALLGIYLSINQEDRAALYRRARKTLNPYYIVAILAAAVLVGALVGALLDYRRGPIVWVISTGSPIEFSKMQGGSTVISGFRVIGNSRSDRPVLFKDGYIQSNITGQAVRFKIGIPGGEISLDEAALEPEGSISLYGRYPAEEAEKTGISLDRFRSEFGSFTFHIQYSDGRVYEREFSSADVDSLIRSAEEHLSRLEKKPPGVLRRK